MRFATLLSTAFYVASVGFLALLRWLGLLPALTVAEMFYGPAVLIVSTWAIFGTVFAFLRWRDAVRGDSSDA